MVDEEVKKEQAQEELDYDTYSKQAMIDGPIAGQSLLTDPANPRPDEKPPFFTALKPALEYVWSKLIEPEKYTKAMQLLGAEVPVLSLAKGMLFVGVRDGKWNPDMMLLLLEPVSYMLIALAERQGIPLVIYEGEQDDEEAEEEIMGVAIEEEQLEDLRRSAESSRVPEGILSAKMQADLESIPKRSGFEVDEMNTGASGEERPSTSDEPMPEAERPAEPQESLMSKPE